MPHGHCYLWLPSLVWTMVFSDLLIGIAYVSISISLYALIRKIKMPFHFVFLAFGLFIFACGATHFMEVYTLWEPDYWTAAAVKVITALASVSTAIVLYPLRPKILAFAEAAKISEERGVKLEYAYQDLEKRVAERTSELELAVRTRDDFLSIASHELKTPLTSLKLQTQMNLRGLDAGRTLTSGEAKRLVSNTDKQITRLIRLVEDMLDVSHIERGNLSIEVREGSVEDLLREVVERFQPEFAKHSTKISMESPTSPVKAHFDPVRLDQVLNNLVANALKFAKTSDVILQLEKKSEWIIIRVIDFGPGIRDGDRHRIFERFERLSPGLSTSGLGLGLYISRQVVEAHGGSLSLQSEPLRGATFVIELPVAIKSDEG